MKRLIPALLLFLAVPAHAKVTTYDWTGRVSWPGWKVALDEIVHGAIQIDDSVPSASELSLDDKKSYFAAEFTFNAGGTQFTSLSYENKHREWGVQDGFQSVQNAALDIGPGPYFSYNWMVTTQRANSLDLFAANNLDQTWLSGEWVMEVNDPNSDKGYFGDGFWGTIESLTRRTELSDAGDTAPTPEPSSFVLMGFALFGLALFRRRKA